MKKLFIFFLFFCASCSPKSAWQYQELSTHPSQFNSANLSFAVSNKFTGIEVQFLKGEFGTLCFLNVLSRSILPLAADPKGALAVLEIEGMQTRFKAIRMEGGQRALLPDEATKMIVDGLCEKKEITIYLESFMTKLSGEEFLAKYEKFQKLSVI